MSDGTQYERERTQLALRLKELRRKSGLTGVEVARAAGMSQPKVSKIENGAAIPSSADIERLADALKVPKKVRTELLGQVDLLHTEFSSWRMLLRNGRRHKQEENASLDRDAKYVGVFQPVVIPGWLQTAAYAKAVLETEPLIRDGRDIGEAITARLERQSVLYDSSKTFDFVVTESVLHWVIGSRAVMLAQIEKLLSISTLKNVSVRVVPTDASRNFLPWNGFVMFDRRCVQVETFTAEIVVSDERDVATYGALFEHILGCTNERKTKALLKTARGSYA